LGKYLIGEVPETAGLTHYERQGEEDRFYADLKKDVYSYFVENKVLTYLRVILSKLFSITVTVLFWV
jgi:Zn-dependent oligopeptidase